MTGIYQVMSEEETLQLTIDRKNGTFYIFVEGVESGFTLKPERVVREGDMLTIWSRFFMRPDEVFKAVLTFDGENYHCQGKMAFGGQLDTVARPVSGPTKFERMTAELPAKRTGRIKKRSDQEIWEAVENLLGQMTLEEKIGQMSQSAGNNTAQIGNEIETTMSLEESIEKGLAGSVISMTTVENLYEYQKLAVEKSRLGIPLMFCQDVIHGYQTIFPVPLACAASFDLEWIEKSWRTAAVEATANGVMYAFSPMLDIARDPRWGRVVEGSGEDPYLGAAVARAQVRGYQGEDLYDDDTMIACLKHFVGYSAAEGGRDYNTAEISETTLHNIYLPPFRAGIEAGAGSVMNSFNTMNGVPVAVNQHILKNVLREELGFDGILISDYAAIEEVVAHGAAEDDRDAVKKTVLATMDFEMGTGLFGAHLGALVEAGELDPELIDASVRRILYYKFKTGLMDDPYKYMRPEEQSRILCEEHKETSREMAKWSMVLLKNDGVLPLEWKQKIAVIGPKGNSRDLLGPWQFCRYEEETVTLAEGLEKAGFAVVYEKGSDIEEKVPGGIESAVEAAEQADVVLLALGETADMTGEAASKQNITIPEAQMELAEAVCHTEKPVVLVLTNGRPLLLGWFEDHVDAILETWFGGTCAGDAITDVLSGAYNPSGKLPVSFPRHCGQIPVYYNHLNTGRPYRKDSPDRFLSRYLDGSNSPLYPFGYGLSYTTFQITDMRLDKKQIRNGETLEATVTVRNVGKRAGAVVVQLYIQDVAASIARPVKELKGFQKTDLEPGEVKILKFRITQEELSFYDIHNRKVCEPGKFQIMTGLSSDDAELISDETELI